MYRYLFNLKEFHVFFFNFRMLNPNSRAMVLACDLSKESKCTLTVKHRLIYSTLIEIRTSFFFLLFSLN